MRESAFRVQEQPDIATATRQPALQHCADVLHEVTHAHQTGCRALIEPGVIIL